MSKIKSSASAASAELVERLDQLRSLDLNGLRAAWRRHVGDSPRGLSAEMLRWRLAYELQQKMHGGLNGQLRRRLAQLHAAFQTDSKYFPLTEHSVTPGTVLVRVWRGRAHKVLVLQDGFTYLGKTYESLSAIASSITGAKWSGRAFFGLRRGAS